MNDERVTKEIEIGPIFEATINCGFYFIVFLIAVALDGLFPTLTPLTCTLVLLPYLIIFGFILLRRSTGHPWFPVGSAGTAVLGFIVIWGIAALIACIFAFNNGLFRPMSLVSQLNHVGTILEAPLAEEFVFRGALLTTLSRTRLSTMSVLHVEVSAIVGAVIFSIIHGFIFLASGSAFSDVLISSVTVLIMSVAYGVIYLRTQNVWYGVFLHTLINFGRWA
jgi:membrane protease YdiL (CAAX protease family)